MRAPNKRFGPYSDAWWPEIKSIFRSLGVNADADALAVERRLFDYERSEFVHGRCSLRDELEFFAAFTAALARSKRGGLPTPKERAKELAAALKVSKTYREYVRPDDSATLEALAGIERAMKADLAELEARNGSAVNAAKPTQENFRKYLLSVWERIVPGARRLGQGKLLVDFLFACANPIFPTTTKPALEQWLKPSARAARRK